MLLPIGHDRGFYRQPWLTIAIIASCFIVHLLMLKLAPSAEALRELGRGQTQLLRKLWDRHGAAWITARRADLRGWPEHKLQRVPDDYKAVRQAFIRDLESGRVVPSGHASLREWEQFAARVRRALGPLAWAYRAGDRGLTLLTYAFLHGGWLHLLGNMLFLWLCGCNLEDRWGRLSWASLYLGGAVVAALSYGFWHDWDPSSAAVGASGAVAAAMGAFLVSYARARIRLLYLYWFGRLFAGTVRMPAYVALPLWLLQETLSMSAEGAGAGVGHSAHVGGFLFGVAFALIFRLSGLDRRLAVQSEQEATLIVAPQAFLDGLAHRERGEHEAARAAFERLLLEQPDHPEAALALFQIALDGGDPVKATTAAERALRNLSRVEDMRSVRQVWIDLLRLAPEHRLSERSWQTLARSFREVDPAASLQCYLRLAAQHPASALHPKALLEAARLQLELRERSAARQTLAELTQRYPASAFADQAQILIERYQLDEHDSVD